MKTIKTYIIMAVAALMLALSGCTLNGPDDPGEYTHRGAVIYKTCMYSSFDVLRVCVDMGFKLNTWIEADENMKRLIEDRWFAQYKIRVDGTGVYGLYSGAELLFTFETGEQPLSADNAQWTITMAPRIFPDYFFSGNNKIEITSTGTFADYSWHVSMVGIDSTLSYIDWEIATASKVMPQSLFDDDFTLSGSGCYIYFDNRYRGDDVELHDTYLKYEIKQPMVWVSNYEGNTYNWYGGKMELLAFNYANKELPVNAEFLGPYNIAITYKDKTEVWNILSWFVVK